MMVGVVIPSYYNGDNWDKNIRRITETLQYLSDLDNLIFLFNFQNMPEKNGEEHSIRAYNLRAALFDTISSLNETWSYKYRHMPKYTPVSMCKIRNDAMMLEPNCDLYVFLDDDNYFKDGSGEHYKFVIEAFKEDPNLGLVMCAGYLGGYNYVGKLRYDPCKYYMTNRGLFFRNIRRSPNSPVYPDSVLQTYVGGYEDAVVAMEILKSGMKLATAFNCPTLHPHVSRIEEGESNKKENEDNGIHDVSISQPALERYVSDEFGLSVRINGAKAMRGLMKTLYTRGYGYHEN